MMIQILLVDDHNLVREGVKQLLSGHTDMEVVAEASDGQEALEKVWQKHFDIVLLDISLPGQNGLEVLKDIKRHDPETRILILSMHPEERYAVRAVKAGASGYLTKGSVTEELIAAIRKISQGGRYITPEVADKMASNLQSGADGSPHTVLSDREFEVMCLIASGKSVTDIANELHLSVKTISTFRKRILDKMHLKHNADMTHYAISHGLID